jgi:hypothetical protein
MKHLEQTLVTYVYSHCKIYNISIHFCSIQITLLQYTSKTSETLRTYACNMSSVGVRTREGPRPTSEFVLRAP